MDGYSSQEPPLSDGEFLVLENELPKRLLDDIGLFFEEAQDTKFFIPTPNVDNQLTDVGYHLAEVNRHLTEICHPEPGNVPSPTCEVPCDKEWDGPYNFELLVDGFTSSRTSWLYSHLVRKIFIDAFQSLPLQFKVDNKGVNDMLFVRALPVYSDAQFMSLPVKRCPVHLKDDLGKGKQNITHVVQCSDPNASYEYNEVSKRYSVVVPLENPPAGSDATTLIYTMACKTSCLGGMNRRPIKIIFTLERNQQVVGRKVLDIRICSCPKRDKLKAEETHLQRDLPQPGPGKRLGNSSDQAMCSKPKSKKRRLNTSEAMDSEEPEFIIKVQGVDDYEKVLEHLIMLKLRAYDLTKSIKDLRAKEEYQRLLDNIPKSNGH